MIYMTMNQSTKLTVSNIDNNNNLNRQQHTPLIDNNNNDNDSDNGGSDGEINYLLKPLNEINEFKILQDPSNINGLKQLFNTFMKQYNNFKCRLIFFSLIGSQSFNLHIESSDQDYFGVYEANIDQILSFQSYYYNRIPIETFQNNNSSNSLKKDKDRDNIINPNETIVHLKPDLTCHEIRHFCKLLLLGNPKLIEPLFINKYCLKTDEWNELIKERKLLITITCLQHYYSTVKVLYFDIKSLINEQSNGVVMVEKSLNNRKSIFKKSYHAIRLLMEMNDLMNGNDITVWLPDDSKEWLLLSKIRKGDEIDESTCEELVSSKYLEFETKFTKLKESSNSGNNESTSIPLEPINALHFLNNWLIKIRRNSIERSKPFSTFKFIKESTTSSTSSPNIALELMKSNNIKGTLIYFGPSGSVLHGLQDDDDDIGNEKDWIGIYASPTDDIMSLFPPPLKHDSTGFILSSDEHIGLNLNPAPNRLSNNHGGTGKKDTSSKGIILYELRYALQLIVNGSYRILECIFSSNNSILNQHPFKNEFYITDAWREFVNSLIDQNENTSKLSNSNLLQQYWGLAKALNVKCMSFKKLKSQLINNNNNIVNDDSFSKSLFFSNYLLFQCSFILDSQKIPSTFINKETNSEQYQLLMNLKHNKLNSVSQIESLINENTIQLDEIKKKLDTLKITQRTDLVEFETIQLLNSFYNKVRKSL